MIIGTLVLICGVVGFITGLMGIKYIHEKPENYLLLFQTILYGCVIPAGIILIIWGV